MHPLDVARFSLGVAFLAYASMTDMRTRKVPNALWALVMPAALVVLSLDLVWQGRIVDLLVVPMVLFLLLPVFFDSGRRTDLKARIVSVPVWAGFAVLSLVSLTAFIRMNGTPTLLLIPGLILLVYGMYEVGLLFGGGDAKAMIALILLVPFHPAGWWGSVDTSALFPFPIVVLTNAMVLFLAIPVAVAVYNVSRRDLGLPEMFFGYRMDLRLARKRHVWPMERVVNGKAVMVLFPSRTTGEEAFKELAGAGYRRIWVAPKVPFMVPLLMGFIAAFTIGDLMLSIVMTIVS